jgi:hypothetical protein
LDRQTPDARGSYRSKRPGRSPQLGNSDIFLLSRANGELQAANQRERDAKDRAEESYRIARAGLEKVTGTVRQDARLKTGEMEDLRNKVLRSQADFYQQFVALRGSEPAFQQERADALVELGRVASELGSQQEAIAAFDRAVTILEQLTQTYPDRPEMRNSLAAGLGAWGLELFNTPYVPNIRPIGACFRIRWAGCTKTRIEPSKQKNRTRKR